MMKCAACGYEAEENVDVLSFKGLDEWIYLQVLEDVRLSEGHYVYLDNEYQRAMYACPECGTVKISV